MPLKPNQYQVWAKGAANANRFFTKTRDALEANGLAYSELFEAMDAAAEATNRASLLLCHADALEKQEMAVGA